MAIVFFAAPEVYKQSKLFKLFTSKLFMPDMEFIKTRETPAVGEIFLALRGSGAFSASGEAANQARLIREASMRNNVYLTPGLAYSDPVSIDA